MSRKGIDPADKLWFRNHYECGDCGCEWEDEWSCMVDDDCPECGSRHWSPYESELLEDNTEQDDED